MTRTAKPNNNLSGVGAILISLGIAVVLYALVRYDRRLIPFVILTIFATSIWAAIDSARIDLQAYKTWIALHPLVLFNAMYLFWLVIFPWYLVVRSKIRAGTLPRKRAL